MRVGARAGATLVGVAVLVVGVMDASSLRAQDPTDLRSALMSKVAPSVVAIRAGNSPFGDRPTLSGERTRSPMNRPGPARNGGDQEIRGYGFVVDASGLVVTNYHVVEGLQDAVVVFSDRRTATVKGFSAYRAAKDLILLQIDATGKTLEPLVFAKRAPAKDDHVFAFGMPSDRSVPIQDGLVTATPSGGEVRKAIDEIAQRDFFGDALGLDGETQWVRSSIPTTPTTSGGPLLSDRGAVIGMNTWMYVGNEQNLALSAADIQEFVDNAMEIVLPLSKLPGVRKNHPEWSDGVGKNTLAAWNRLWEVRKSLSEGTQAAMAKFPKVPEKNARWPQKMSEYCEAMFAAHQGYAAEVRQVAFVDVDRDLVRFAFREADLAQRFAAFYAEFAAIFGEGNRQKWQFQWRLNDLRREVEGLLAARGSVLIDLGQRYDETFPDSSDLPTASPVAEDDQDRADAGDLPPRRPAR